MRFRIWLRSQASTFVTPGRESRRGVRWRAAERSLGSIVGHAQAAIIEETDEAAPAVEAIGDGLGNLIAVLVANAPALPRRLAVDVAFDGKQGIDAFDGFDREPRYCFRALKKRSTRLRSQ